MLDPRSYSVSPQTRAAITKIVQLFIRGIRTWDQDGEEERFLHILNSFGPLIVGPLIWPIPTIKSQCALISKCVDVDNSAKFVSDSLNGLLYMVDQQIFSLSAMKIYDTNKATIGRESMSPCKCWTKKK